MTETLAYGYSCESTQWELSNEYQVVPITAMNVMADLMISSWAEFTVEYWSEPITQLSFEYFENSC